MRAIRDLAGQTFGELRVVRFQESRRGTAYWSAVCTCGALTIVSGAHLTRGLIISCGHVRRAHLTRGRAKANARCESKSPEYHIWKGMKYRCLNPHREDYPLYGGRGITVCDRWRESFANFYADMGPRPSPRHSIDRIDNNRDYDPTNCRWATIIEQNNNRRPRRKK